MTSFGMKGKMVFKILKELSLLDAIYFTKTNKYMPIY